MSKAPAADQSLHEVEPRPWDKVIDMQSWSNDWLTSTGKLRASYMEEDDAADAARLAPLLERARMSVHNRLQRKGVKDDEESGPFESKPGAWLKDPDGKMAGSTSEGGAGGGGGIGSGPDFTLKNVEGSNAQEVFIGGVKVGLAIKHPETGIYNYQPFNPAKGHQKFGSAEEMMVALTAPAAPVTPAGSLPTPTPASILLVGNIKHDPHSYNVWVNNVLGGEAKVTGSAVVFTPAVSFAKAAEAAGVGLPTSFTSEEDLKQTLTEVKGKINAASTQLVATIGGMGKLSGPTVEYKTDPKTGYTEVTVNGLPAGYAVQAGTGKVFYQPSGQPTSPGPVETYGTWAELLFHLQKPVHTPAALPEATVKFVSSSISGKYSTAYVNGKPAGSVFINPEGHAILELGADIDAQDFPSLHALELHLKSTAPPGPDSSYTPPVIHPSIADAAAKIPLAGLPEPLVRTNGGEWNQETSIRLAKEHAARKAAIDADIQKVIGTSVALGEEGETDWGNLTTHMQDSIEQSWREAEFDAEYETQKEYWSEHYALGEAMHVLAQEFDQVSEPREWAKEAIDDVIKGRELDGKPPLPYSAKELLAALSEVEFTGDDDEYPNVEFRWDTSALTPAGYDPAQETLPGIKPIEPDAYFTPEVQGELESQLLATFKTAAEAKVPDLDTPDHLTANADEIVNDTWDNMNDEEKYQWAKDQGLVDSDDDAEGEVVMPDHLDPMNDNVDENYRRTQRLAKALSVERATEVIKERGLSAFINDGDFHSYVSKIDDKLWQGWVGSSTTPEGLLLQLATAEELGGRMNEDRIKQGSYRTVQEVRDDADNEYRDIGGYEGVKAYVRAKWEVTQELMDRAGVQEVGVYRSIDAPDKRAGRNSGQQVNEYIERNGAASFTTDPSVANGWGTNSRRVIVRATVPRTAIISIPAYGKNIHSEHEVVVAGTGWTGWDAWAATGPPMESVPMHLERGTAEEQRKWAERQKQG